MLLAIHGRRYGYRELHDYTDRIKDELRTVRNVGKLATYGEQSEEIFDPARSVERDVLERMNAVLAHRGPDDAGIYCDGPIGLAHRRLSIIDLSPAGHQPMSNEDGTIWIVFNGEIYNFQSLRPDLLRRGHRFRSNTDTEVILHLYEDHGTACLRFLQGMFAIAIWDGPRRQLFLARGAQFAHQIHV